MESGVTGLTYSAIIVRSGYLTLFVLSGMVGMTGLSCLMLLRVSGVTSWHVPAMCRQLYCVSVDKQVWLVYIGILMVWVSTHTHTPSLATVAITRK